MVVLFLDFPNFETLGRGLGNNKLGTPRLKYLLISTKYLSKTHRENEPSTSQPTSTPAASTTRGREGGGRITTRGRGEK